MALWVSLRRLPFVVGSRPTKGQPSLRLAPLLAAGLAAAGRARGWLPLAGCCPCGRPPLASSQAMAGRPCRGSGRDQPPLDADNMHVATPLPQAVPTFAVNRCNERVEEFYVIQSHHTQFKTNLSHENLGSDTTVVEPQRVHHMRRSYIPIFQIRMEKMKEVKRPPL
ncbi:hypothetical protein GW17_00020570 [Ensete ventricosum]|nr:hypothetical protein GW17_00020570 [Ensete ventricosum]